MDTYRHRSLAVRTGIALGAMALAALALAQGVAQIVDAPAPDAALAVAPWFAPAHARKAELALARKDITTATREATAALRRDATLVPAVRTLGQLDEGAPGTGLLTLALRLSRRDVPTHMALLRRAAAAGDVDAVLSHYSQALRTNQRSWPLLLPPLVQAAREPGLVAPLARELAKQPQWLYPFYLEWVKSSPDTRAMTMLSREMTRRGRPLNRDVRVGLLARLVDARDWLSLRDELARARPACGADACLDGGFRRYGLLLPVDWSPAAVDRALVVRVPAGNTGFALDYAFSGPGDALIARRLMLLPQGDYAFAYDLRNGGGAATGAGTGNVALSLACAEANGAILSDPTRVDGAIRRTRAHVPAACPAQWLVVRVASDDSVPVSGRIARLRLEGATDRTR